MSKYKFIPTSLSLYRRGDSPIFGESVTNLRLDDEAGGIFLIIEQAPNQFGPGGSIRLDFEEVPQLIAAINVLKNIAKEVDKDESIVLP